MDALWVSMANLEEGIQNKEFFKRPPPMELNAIKDKSRYCAYYHDRGHDNKECFHLKKLVDVIMKENKLKDLIMRWGQKHGKW